MAKLKFRSLSPRTLVKKKLRMERSRMYDYGQGIQHTGIYFELYGAAHLSSDAKTDFILTVSFENIFDDRQTVSIGGTEEKS